MIEANARLDFDCGALPTPRYAAKRPLDESTRQVFDSGDVGGDCRVLGLFQGAFVSRWPRREVARQRAD